MTVLIHELKRNRLSLIIWSSALAFMLGVCVLIYPEMSSQMGDISAMFSDMGAFSDAFGMDQLNFGEFMGYFGVECGNTLGLGGSLFAAIVGISAIAKEEKEHTAEFLLTHPLSRARILTEKLFSILIQLILLNLSIIAVTAICAFAVSAEVQIGRLALLFLANFLLQVEIAAITFCLSAFLRRGGMGIGLGISLMLYFLNILANLSEKTEFLKWITPFGYTDGSYIIENGSLKLGYLLLGSVFAAVSIALAYWHYLKKDIS